MTQSDCGNKLITLKSDFIYFNFIGIISFHGKFIKHFLKDYAHSF